MSDAFDYPDYPAKDGEVPEEGQVAGLYLRQFNFTYATSGLASGAVIYTPSVGDILYDAWFSVTTAWDGTTALGDFGVEGATNGLFYVADGVINFQTADVPVTQNSSLLGSQSNLTLLMSGYADTLNREVAPVQFTAATPLTVWVSASGNPDGSATGATVGAATLYLMLVTPY